jgi:hypothetical protein
MRKVRLHPFLSCTPFDALLAATCEPLQLNKNRLPSLTPGPYVKFLSVLIQLGDRDCANETRQHPITPHSQPQKRPLRGKRPKLITGC